MDFSNKNILVLGAGISGISVACILQNRGAKVILSDTKTRDKIHYDLTAIEKSGVTLSLGNQGESLLEHLDYLILSPGISINVPLVQRAKALDILVMSEIEVAYQLCHAPIVAITGTNGKTTTTTLVGEMLRTTGKEIVVGGNIGSALTKEVQHISSSGFVVAEISSFQLEAIIDFSPKIAAVLNLTPDHLDRHLTMELYKSTKELIFKNQKPEDYLVLNYDDPQVRDMSERTLAKVMFFSRQVELSEGIFIKDENFTLSWEGRTYEICPVQDLHIKGGHNVENTLAACGIAFLAGAEITELAKVIQRFEGVEHRIEFVAKIKDVEYYNDSKATNPESSVKALEAFPGHVLLIAGGRDKMTDLTEFVQLIREKVDHLILLGEAKDRFHEAARNAGITHIHIVKSVQDAVSLASRLAKPQQVVLLSPACSSYDMFANYEERGKTFKNLVRQLG
jgi:UDP-N-acetylmuramoylalanine--D-glutamate ligase